MAGSLLLLGGAACVWDDIERLGRAKVGRNHVINWPGHIMTVNMALLFVEQPQHAYSNDGKWLKRLVAARRPEWGKRWPGKIRLHSIQTADGVEHWNFSGPGSSGLNAARVAVKLGYEEIILCGIPLDDSPHIGEPHWQHCNFTREVAGTAGNDENRFWAQARKNEFEGRVKSMSGRTREWLGSP